MRLSGPWQFEPLARTVVFPDGHIEERAGSVPSPGQLRVPTTYCGTALDGFRGRVRWRRKFHPPRSLEPNERLWLVFDAVDYFATVGLNGTQLGQHEGYFDPFEFDVTLLIAERNELVVETDCPAEIDGARRRLIRGSLEFGDSSFVGGLWRDVALEVRSFAFLRDVFVQTELLGPGGCVTVAGRVVGEPGVPLHLDLSVEGCWLARRRVDASPDGIVFELHTHLECIEPWWPRNLGQPRSYNLQVELHGAARTLDSVVCRVGFRKLVFDSSISTAELDGRKFPVVCMNLESSNNPLGSNSNRILGQIDSASDCKDQLLLIRTAGRMVEPDFYKQADLDGLLIWQDFPLSGGHSETPELWTEAARQARQMVRQLGRHPCVALWSSNTHRPNRDSELNAVVRNAIVAVDPTRICL